MLAIRLQRAGRSGQAQFRLIVQDSRFSPTRGRVVAYLGSYNPHTKTATLDSQKAGQYLENGAQPSDRVARLLQKEGVKLPAWVKLTQPKERAIRNPDKRRSTRPAEPKTPADASEAKTAEESSSEATAAQEAAVETSTAETPSESATGPEPTDPAAEDKPAE